MRAAAFGIALALSSAPAFGAPSVISIDYCADQYVLALADRAQLRGVSPRARQAFSYHRERAAGLPVVQPVAEAVLDARPELVVRFWGGNRRMTDLLARVGVETVSIVYGHESETIFANLTRVAAAFGRDGEADALIADQRRRIATLKALPPMGMRALYLTPSGTTGGTGTDVDALIRLAGLENVAVELGYTGWRTVSLEQLLLSPPDVFIGSFFDDNDVARSSWSVARHGRLAEIMSRVPTVNVPGRLLSCSGLFSVDAAEIIRNALEPRR